MISLAREERRGTRVRSQTPGNLLGRVSCIDYTLYMCHVEIRVEIQDSRCPWLQTQRDYDIGAVIDDTERCLSSSPATRLTCL